MNEVDGGRARLIVAAPNRGFEDLAGVLTPGRNAPPFFVRLHEQSKAFKRLGRPFRSNFRKLLDHFPIGNHRVSQSGSPSLSCEAKGLCKLRQRPPHIKLARGEPPTESREFRSVRLATRRVTGSNSKSLLPKPL